MAKFDLKALSPQVADIKKQIANTEKNRVKAQEMVEKPALSKSEKPKEVQKAVKEEPKEKREEFAKKEIVHGEQIKKTKKAQRPADNKIISVTLPKDVNVFLKVHPKMESTTITSFIHELVQKKIEKEGINLQPNYEKLADVKRRSAKGADLVVVPLQVNKADVEWLKKAAICKGLNLSQYIEKLIREVM